MPTVFNKNGYRFFFYSNDHLPIHIHVKKGGGEAKFNVSPFIELVESAGLKTKELAEIEAIIEDGVVEIINKWNQYFPL
jgi:hypothetical protein